MILSPAARRQYLVRNIIAAVAVSLLGSVAGMATVATTTGCTAAQKSDVAIATGITNAVAPLVCAGLTASGQAQAGSVCGTVATDVSAVSKLVQGILDSLPAPAPGARVLPMASQPSAIVYRGVTITLPAADLAAKVQAKLPGTTPAAQ